jgi:hypothetical protein
MEARATLTDAREAPAASASTSALASANSAASSNPITVPPPITSGNRGPGSDGSLPGGAAKITDPPAVIAATDDAEPSDARPAPPSAAAADASAEPLPVVQPLSGKIPLPRHRPSELVMVQITPANVPMPRPRPSGAGTGGDDSDASGSPLNFIQNLFH